MKKLIALLLTVCMLMTMLAACDNSEPTGAPTAAPTEAPTASPTEAPTEAPDDGSVDTSWILEEDTSMSGEVNFWIPFKGNQGMDAMIAEFNEIYPNIKINLNTYKNNSDGNVGVNTAIMAGEVDVLASFGLENTHRRWENGLFVDITDKVNEEGIDLMEQWGYDIYKYEDRIFSFPCGGMTYYIAINMTAWEEAGLLEKYNGLPKEWTWDEYIEASRAMTKVGEDGLVEVYGGSDFQSNFYFLFTNCQLTGGDMYYNPDGTAVYDNPRVIAALERELKAELVDKIWYPKTTYQADNIQAHVAYCNGDNASTVTCHIIRFLHDTETFPEVDWVTGFAPYPVEEIGETNYMSGVAPYSHAGIATNCQDEDAAWAWLKWYSTYGVKYLLAAGHQPKWKGTEPGSAIEVIYGSEEEAKKWIDIESFNHVIGRTDLPAFAETNLTAYTDVSAALGDVALEMFAGLIAPEEAMKQAAEAANEAIQNAG